MEDRYVTGHHELHVMPTYARTHFKYIRTDAVIALWAITCLCFLALTRCEAQNLVPNPSFEEHEICPARSGFVSKPLHWDRWDQDPDYFHACAGDLYDTDTLLDVPWNGWSWQYAHEGDAYVGMACYIGEDFHELVGAQLLQDLDVGHTYYVSYWVNLASEGSYWWSRWACNNQGVLFTMTEHIWSGVTGDGPEFIPRNYAHVHNQEIVTDTAGWTLVSGSFVADSAYRYIVLGNFFRDSLTDTVHLNTEPSIAAYYFYDAICVSPLPGECPVVTSIDRWPNEVLRMQLLVGGNWLWVGGAGSGSIGSVFDAGGRLVRQWALHPDAPLDISGLADGLYMVRVEASGAAAWSEKFVVMR